MTAYNREKYIAEAIESVLASSYKNFELIIVDDCSSDNTIAIAKKYEQQDSRVHIYVNEKNLGDYPNRNKAASYATGKYLKYVDADDYIYRAGLELLIQMMEKFPNAGWGLCSLEQYIKKPFPFELTPRVAYEYNYFGPGLFHKAPLSSIIKREVFEQSGGFSPIRMAGDFEMWHRLAQQHNVVLMPDGIVWYREHDAQEMNNYFKFGLLYEQIRAKYLKDDNCPLDKRVIQKIISEQEKKLAAHYLKNLLRLRFDKSKLNLQQLKLYK
ncbi:MAG TPA: glycosyltransferase family 2 protein [Puia sp.]|nr:glycosyltransferase family 2 protein [Puia sp.]